MIRWEDLRASVMVVGTEAALIGRLDVSILGITCPRGEKRRVIGMIGRCANLGYFVMRLAGRTLCMIDMLCLNGMTAMLPLNIDVGEGQTLAVGGMSSSGTAVGAVSLCYDDNPTG